MDVLKETTDMIASQRSIQGAAQLLKMYDIMGKSSYGDWKSMRSSFYTAAAGAAGNMQRISVISNNMAKC